MTVSAELIVLNHTKFGESSIVLHTLSREYGRRSFLVRVGKGSAMALFLPLNILEAEVTENPKSTLWTARRFKAKTPLLGIRGNIYKNSMTLFMSEVLYRCITEGAYETGLFEWCEKAVLTLDALESDFANFHIHFLLELSSVLGFSPSAEDLAPYCHGDIAVLRRFLGAGLGEAMLIPLSGAARSAICEDLLKYIERHSDSTLNIRSLKVLSELFGP